MNYYICFHFLSVLLTQCFVVSLAMAIMNLDTDRFALIEFKDHIVDPQNVLSNNWTTSSSVCSWVGVSCGTIHERVVALNLTSMNLKGTISPHLGNLSFLSSLDLSSNNFYGHLPEGLGRLHRLRRIELSFNDFNGGIPSWIGNLHGVKTLRMRNNSFTGRIPQTLGNMSNLEILNLEANKLYGSLPDEICHHLPRLEKLGLGDNKLSGNIPSSIGECYNLRVLELFTNQLSGSIPESIWNSTMLEEVFLYENNLEGNLPPMTKAPKLRRLVLWRNKLGGNILESISNASMLTDLQLQYNSFSGLIPNTLGSLRHLEWFHISNNHFTTESATHEWSFLSSLANCRNLSLIDVSGNPLNGVLPSYIGNLSSTSLQYFYAKDCELKGNIPIEVGNLSNTLLLTLGNNKLSGSIPTSIGGLRSIQALFLYSNDLDGIILESICGLERLYTLSLSSNKLHGSILACFGNMTSLRYLSLDCNRLSSAIPSALWNLKDIQGIDLTSNYLNSSLALDAGHLRSLRYLYLSENRLTGGISSTIGGIQTLVSLDLSNNKLHGHIPESFGGLISLESLDLCNNGLSGVIPESLEKLSNLNYFNVSFNRLEGEIPTKGCFANFTSTSFMKNYALCGPPRLLVPPCKENIHQKSKMNIFHALRYGLPTIGIIVVLIVLTIIYRKCRSRSTTDLPVTDDLVSWKTRKRISYAELYQATGGFNESNMLGFGSYGYVYKGRLSDGMEVAVKVFNLQREGAFRSFDIECEAMRNIVHRNLVKVITCFSNIDFKAIVLDFMPNGSLEKWLYSENLFLDTLQRLDIMIDVAVALEHLHTGHPTPIIHCDLKPSNILLDEDMIAHVGDFGISKLLGEDDETKQTMTLATIGYMAPEFGSTGIVSIKSDVYSYGIVLMETFMTKRPTDETFAEEMSMRHWMKRSLSEGVIDIAGADLLSTEDEYFVDKANCILSIMNLALDCSAELPDKRTSMKDVVVELKKIRQRLRNSIKHV